MDIPPDQYTDQQLMVIKFSCTWSGTGQNWLQLNKMIERRWGREKDQKPVYLRLKTLLCLSEIANSCLLKMLFIALHKVGDIPAVKFRFISYLFFLKDYWAQKLLSFKFLNYWFHNHAHPPDISPLFSPKESKRTMENKEWTPTSHL